VEPKSGRHRTTEGGAKLFASGVGWWWVEPCRGPAARGPFSFRRGSSAPHLPARYYFHGGRQGRLKPDSGGRTGGARAGHGEAEMVVCSMRKSFKDSLKVLEADIQHANTL